jgi:hypothetical protein
LKSESQFRAFVGGVGDSALYMLDPACIVSNWNVGGERIQGLFRRRNRRLDWPEK